MADKKQGFWVDTTDGNTRFVPMATGYELLNGTLQFSRKDGGIKEIVVCFSISNVIQWYYGSEGKPHLVEYIGNKP